MFRTRIVAAASAALMLAACGDGQESPEASPASVSPAEPTGSPLSKTDIVTLASAFGDNPLTGGQTAGCGSTGG